jgi:hypothetical protein
MGALGALSCQRIVGIHGTVPSPDGGDAAVDASVSDAMSGDITANGAGGRGDGSGDVTTDGAGGGAVESGGAESGPPEAPDAAGGTDGASDDAGQCGNPWHAENVEARVFNIGGGTTACGSNSLTAPAFSAALNGTDFRGAIACGGCLRVQPTFGSASVVVTVVDQAAGPGMLLSQQAMDQIAPPGTGLVNVDWRLVPCETNGQPLRYFVQDGSGASFVAIQVRNQRYPTGSMAAVGSRGQTVAFVPSSNFWQSSGLGPGPLTLRLTDVNGQTIEDSGIVISPPSESVGQSQFPLCPP